MESLNKQIYQIFNNLIDSGTKFISKIDYSGHKIVYTVDSGLGIVLGIANYLKGKEPWDNSFSTIEKVLESERGFYWYTMVDPDDKYSLVFTLKINGKEYYVPELSRIEKAHALDTLDKTIAEYEHGILCQIAEKTIEDDL